MSGTLSCNKQMFYFLQKTLPFSVENFQFSAVTQQPSMDQFCFQFLSIKDCSPTPISSKFEYCA